MIEIVCVIADDPPTWRALCECSWKSERRLLHEFWELLELALCHGSECETCHASEECEA